MGVSAWVNDYSKTFWTESGYPTFQEQKNCINGVNVCREKLNIYHQLHAFSP